MSSRFNVLGPVLLLGVVLFSFNAKAGAQDASKKLRDPFWPVGYFPENWNKPEQVVADDVPEPEVKVVSQGEAAGWEAASEKLNIAGVSRRGDSIVLIINGQVVKMGNTFSVRQAGSIYTWRVEAADEKGGLKLKRVSVGLIEKSGGSETE